LGGIRKVLVRFKTDGDESRMNCRRLLLKMVPIKRRRMSIYNVRGIGKRCLMFDVWSLYQTVPARKIKSGSISLQITT